MPPLKPETNISILAEGSFTSWSRLEFWIHVTSSSRTIFDILEIVVSWQFDGTSVVRQPQSFLHGPTIQSLPEFCTEWGGIQFMTRGKRSCGVGEPQVAKSLANSIVTIDSVDYVW